MAAVAIFQAPFHLEDKDGLKTAFCSQKRRYFMSSVELENSVCETTAENRRSAERKPAVFLT